MLWDGGPWQNPAGTRCLGAACAQVPLCLSVRAVGQRELQSLMVLDRPEGAVAPDPCYVSGLVYAKDHLCKYIKSKMQPSGLSPSWARAGWAWDLQGLVAVSLRLPKFTWVSTSSLTAAQSPHLSPLRKTHIAINCSCSFYNPQMLRSSTVFRVGTARNGPGWPIN